MEFIRNAVTYLSRVLDGDFVAAPPFVLPVHFIKGGVYGLFAYRGAVVSAYIGCTILQS